MAMATRPSGLPRFDVFVSAPQTCGSQTRRVKSIRVFALECQDEMVSEVVQLDVPFSGSISGRFVVEFEYAFVCRERLPRRPVTGRGAPTARLAADTVRAELLPQACHLTQTRLRPGCSHRPPRWPQLLARAAISSCTSVSPRHTTCHRAQVRDSRQVRVRASNSWRLSKQLL